MELRNLQMKDAPFMLEWMHDPSVTAYLAKDFKSMKLENCESFIAFANGTDSDVHLAVVNDEDEYMGTVSLKALDPEEGTAEFAITMRACAQGKGFARFAIREILRRGFQTYHLRNIYWDVRKDNAHAVRFYDHLGPFRASDEKLAAHYFEKMGIAAEVQNQYLCYIVDPIGFEKQEREVFA